MCAFRHPFKRDIAGKQSFVKPWTYSLRNNQIICSAEYDVKELQLALMLYYYWILHWNQEHQPTQNAESDFFAFNPQNMVYYEFCPSWPTAIFLFARWSCADMLGRIFMSFVFVFCFCVLNSRKHTKRVMRWRWTEAKRDNTKQWVLKLLPMSLLHAFSLATHLLSSLQKGLKAVGSSRIKNIAKLSAWNWNGTFIIIVCIYVIICVWYIHLAWFV